MNDWQEFLAAHGGQTQDGDILTFGEALGDYPALATTTVIADLGDQGVLGVEGSDGAKFIQGQATCDIQALTATTTVTGAFCNPKGRVIADFRAVATASERIALVMPRELVATSMQALTKYAAFFKAKLVDRSADYRLLGVAGPRAPTLLAEYFPVVPTACGQIHCHDGNFLMRLAEDRWLLLAPATAAADLWRQLAGAAKPVGLPFWQLLAIRAGEGCVRAQTSGEFIPQMLNFQALGAISFKKGCYTGQEVVARMQYLGKLKRHMYRLVLADTAVPAPGTEVLVPEDAQSAGTVVTAAPADAEHCEALVVLKDDASRASKLLIGQRAVAVQRAPLPYAVNHDSVDHNP